MATKRASPEEQTNEGSDSVFQQDDNAKRAKFMPLSNTTLLDLPMELVECILVKAVALEVMDVYRVKSNWKEKAAPVINQLGTVCPYWKSILATNFFRNELHRTFDAQKTRSRFQILHQSPLQFHVLDAVTFKDQLFLLCRPHHNFLFAIHVHDRNNMTQVKGVIPLPEIQPTTMVACSVSNCLYILNNKPHDLSVLRIAENDEHQFTISPLISNMRRRYDDLSVATNGSLFLSWQKRKELRAVISVYDANGYLLYETSLSSDVYSAFYKIIPKSNGSFVMVSSNDYSRTKLTEIDMYGAILRQYQSSLFVGNAVCPADKNGRIVLIRDPHRFELLDSEFNLLAINNPPLPEDQFACCGNTHYSREGNDVTTVVDVDDDDDCLYGVLTIFHFT